MKKLITVVILLFSVFILGCIGQTQTQTLNEKTLNNNEKALNNNEKTLNNNEKTNEKISLNETDWCKPGTIIQSVGPLGNITNFEINGITNHNGLELCKADYDMNESMVQYFNKDKSYNIMAIKTNNGTMEINVNRVLKN